MACMSAVYPISVSMARTCSSVTAAPTETKIVNYTENWLVWDEARRTALMAKLAELAVAIEVEMKAPQDIEGCVVGDDIYVLQSRNQVL